MGKKKKKRAALELESGLRSEPVEDLDFLQVM
jgi:hypothetical protein